MHQVEIFVTTFVIGLRYTFVTSKTQLEVIRLEKQFPGVVRFADEICLRYSLEHTGRCYNLLVTAGEPLNESIFVSDIARNKTEAEHLLFLLADNLVFPVHVMDILDDLLGA